MTAATTGAPVVAEPRGCPTPGACSCPAAPTAEPVAVVCDAYELRWAGAGPIAPLIRRNGIKVGDKLYTAPQAPASQALTAAQIEEISLRYEEAARRALSAPKEPASDRVLTDQQCGAIAYQLTKRLVIDISTARAAVDAALAPQAPQAAEGVLTEIRTIMNGTQHWPIGTGIVDAIRALALAAQAPQTAEQGYGASS